MQSFKSSEVLGRSLTPVAQTLLSVFLTRSRGGRGHGFRLQGNRGSVKVKATGSTCGQESRALGIRRGWSSRGGRRWAAAEAASQLGGTDSEDAWVGSAEPTAPVRGPSHTSGLFRGWSPSLGSHLLAPDVTPVASERASYGKRGRSRAGSSHRATASHQNL